MKKRKTVKICMHFDGMKFFFRLPQREPPLNNTTITDFMTDSQWKRVWRIANKYIPQSFGFKIVEE